MSQVLREGDFVELDYTGKVVEGNLVFDTTSEEIAKKNDIHNPGNIYGPLKICVGKNHVISGLDKSLAGKETGKTYTFRISPEKGFGQKDPKLIKLIPTGKLTQQKINPVPGLQVNVDGILGVIRTVSGGRTVIDFNNPLSGRELEYEVSLRRVVEDAKEKADAMLRLAGAPFENQLDGEKLEIKADSPVPEDLRNAVSKAITGTIPEIKSVSFQVLKKPETGKNSNNKI